MQNLQPCLHNNTYYYDIIMLHHLHVLYKQLLSDDFVSWCVKEIPVFTFLSAWHLYLKSPSITHIQHGDKSLCNTTNLVVQGIMKQNIFRRLAPMTPFG